MLPQFAPKILSVERYPAAAILIDAGVKPEALGDLSTWPQLGGGKRIAELIANRRDAESVSNGKATVTRIVPESVKISESTLEFQAVQDIPVMRPDLLEEQVTSTLTESLRCLSCLIVMQLAHRATCFRNGQAGLRELKRISIFRGELRTGESVGYRT